MKNKRTRVLRIYTSDYFTPEFGEIVAVLSQTIHELEIKHNLTIDYHFFPLEDE